MPSLLDSVAGLLSPQLVSQVANRLGEPETNVSRGMQTALTTVLAGLANRSGDGGLMRNVLDLGSRYSSDPATTSPATLLDPMTLTPDVAAATGTPTATGGLLSSLFGGGGGTAAVGDAIARFAGLRDGSASSLLTMAVPLVLSLLGRHAREDNLDATGLASMLGSQRDVLAAALPPGIGALIGPQRAEPVAEERRPVMAPMVARAERRRPLIPILLGLVVLGLVAYWALRDRTPDATVAGTGMRTDTAAGMVGAPAPTPGDTGPLAGMVQLTLPGGMAMNVPPAGIEARLIRFLQDSAATVNDTTWFDFDRLLFETGSANLTEDSEEQLRFVAQILNAYPNVTARIGGYTDNTGDPQANVKLSQARAEAVVGELVDLGIAPGRLDAEGYGAEHPVADNSTEAGRAQNRRIALRVTAK